MTYVLVFILLIILSPIIVDGIDWIISKFNL